MKTEVQTQTRLQRTARRRYEAPQVRSEIIALATPMGGSFGFASGPFRDGPPEEGEEGSKSEG